MGKLFKIILHIATFYLIVPAWAISQNVPFPPPRQIQVFAIQQLSFGDFYPGGTGGTIIVSPHGIRSSTGTVVLVGGNSFPAIFDVKLIPGRLVQIVTEASALLNRIGGGGTLTMDVGPSDKGTSFITSGGHPFRNPVQVGGTLYVGNMASNPAGQYEGSFTVTFIQE